MSNYVDHVTDTEGTVYNLVDTEARSTKADNSVIGNTETSLVASKAYAVGDYFTYNGTEYKVTVAIASGGAITIGTNCVATSIQNELSEIKYRVGILSPKVPAYVARCTPPRNKNITTEWESGTTRAEVAEGNFKNVIPGDYIQKGNTILWVANPDGRYGKGDQTNNTNYPAYGTHHVEFFVKYMGDTSLWLGKGNADGSWQTSANDKGRCPWNAATDVDPTSTTAVGANNTNITRTYNGANVSGYMGSFIRERMDAVILPYLQNLFGSSNILKYREIHGNAVNTEAAAGGIPLWKGCTSGWGWYDRYLDLPSEVELYGSRIFGDAYDQGTQCEQLPLFRNMQIQDVIGRLDIWTKGVASSSSACHRYDYGHANAGTASAARWACPLVCVK